MRAILLAVLLLADTGLAATDVETARLSYERARALPTSDQEARTALFTAGLAAAERARAATPDDPGALLWWVANKGEVALARGKLRALGDIPALERALAHLRHVAPDYESAAADRGLARLYQLAPPIISIGSSKKAAAHYEAAMKLAPEFMGNQVLFADFLASKGDERRAKELARTALAADVSGIDPMSHAEWIAIAKDILESH